MDILEILDNTQTQFIHIVLKITYGNNKLSLILIQDQHLEVHLVQLMMVNLYGFLEENQINKD